MLLAVGLLAPAFGQTCSFSISPAGNPSVPAGGGSFGPVSVTAVGTRCQWTAASDVPWMQVTFGKSGSGDGTFGYAVDPNSGPPRSGTITAAGLTFSVTQAGCTFAFTPSSASYAFGGGNGSFMVQPTPSSCTWAGTTTSDWISISSGAGGPGNGTLSYGVAPNPTPFVRMGNINVGAQTFSIREDAAPCVTSLAPGTANVAAGGGSGSFRVTVTPNGCTWTATASGFVTVTSGASGTNTGTVGYTVAANTGSQRSGAIRVNDQSFNITQDAAACSYTAIPDQSNFGPQGGTSAIAIGTAAVCSWTAASNGSFITIGTTSGTGPMRIGFTVAVNNGAKRSGTLTVAGQTVTISQDAGPPPTTPQLDSVKNSAGNGAGPISPGEVVTLSGGLLGPGQVVFLQTTADGQGVTTLLAGTRVLFDGVAAPMIYTSAAQVSAVTPYGLDGKGSTQVQVEYQGVVSNSLTMSVASSAPAIYTFDGSGSGQGYVINQDFTANGPGNAATSGSQVWILITGGGQTTPPGVDGQFTGTTPPQASLPVAVRIGGLDAAVQSAAGWPGLVAGLMLVNAAVPDSAPAGDAVSVVVQVGDASSQDGVIMAVAPR
jgi:uncharacterized protein (TIGR03437 family)